MLEQSELDEPAQADPPQEPSPQLNPEDVKQEVESTELAKGDVPDNEDRKTLHRYMRRRMQLSTEFTRIKDQTKAMLKELENRIDGLDYVYAPIVEPIVRKMLEGQKRTKSVKTPYGTAGFKTENKGGKLVIVDEGVVLAAAENEGMEKFAAPVWQPVMAEIEAYFKSTGEIPPGCEVKAETEKFYAR